MADGEKKFNWRNRCDDGGTVQLAELLHDGDSTGEFSLTDREKAFKILTRVSKIKNPRGINIAEDPFFRIFAT